MRKRLGKKLFGLGKVSYLTLFLDLNNNEPFLGVRGPTFLGGAGFGFAAGLLSYSIIHRYFYLVNFMYEEGIWTKGWDSNFYRTYYKRKVFSTLWEHLFEI